MKNTILALLFFGITCTLFADSGGPYEFVPDLAQDERPPTCQIPPSSHSLEFYLSHFPNFIWDKKLNEPTTFDWKVIKDFYASPVDCGYLPYGPVIAIRYISKQRISQGSLHADAILLLAHQPNSAELTPIYFTLGGPSIYNHRVATHEGNTPYISIFRDYSGTGAFVDEIRIGRSDSGFYRIKKR